MRLVTFNGLRAVSFIHSCVYFALIICAVTIGPGPTATNVLGWTHGVLWIVMSIACIAAARARVIPFWLAVTVAVLGGLGPFAGSIGFVLESRKRAQKPAATEVQLN